MALLPGSPAAQAGSGALAVDASGNLLITDQRGTGFPRFANGTVDIGAYEFTLGQTISFESLPAETYGAAPITLTATSTSGLPVSFNLISGPANLAGSVLTITGAGPIEIEAACDGNSTYAPVTMDESFSIAPAPLNVNAVSESLVYGGVVPTLTYTYTGLVNDDASASFSGSLTTTATSSSSVGDYSINAGTLTATGNYTIGSFDPGSLTINPAPLTVNGISQSMTYGGTVPELTYTYTGLVNGDSIATFSGSLATTGTTSSGVGGYSINAGTLTATGNYTMVTFDSGTLVVNPAPLTVSVVSQSMTYGGTVPTLIYTYTGLVNGDTNGTFSGSLATTVTSLSNVGSYPVTVGTLTATGNYTIGTFDLGTLVVNPAPLTVNGISQSMTYGGRRPALTYAYTGLVNDDASATFSGSLATTATSSSSVGDYSVSAGSLTATGNYTIGEFDPGTLVVNRAPLTIMANSASMTQGSALPTLTVTYIGFVNGDTSLSTPPTISTAGTALSAAGTYLIVATGARSIDYTISYANGVLIITPANNPEPSQETIPFNITTNDPNDLFGACPALAGAIPGAEQALSKLFYGDGSIQIQIVPNNNAQRCDTTTSAVVAIGTLNGKTVVETGAEYEANTGINPDGTAPEITINLDPAYLATVANGSQAVATMTAILEHETCHGLGFLSYRTTTGADYGELNTPNETVYDAMTSFGSDGILYFTGPLAEAAYGGPVPLTSLGSTDTTGENFTHVGNPTGPGSSLVGTDLMNGILLSVSAPSKLDLAILADLGWNISGKSSIIPTPPVTPITPSAPTVTRAFVVYTQQHNKRGTPIGKPVFAGFEFDYSASPTAADYQVSTYVTKRVGRKLVQVLQPVQCSVKKSVDTVQLILKVKQAFIKGGQISGTCGIYEIAKGAKSISLA